MAKRRTAKAEQTGFGFSVNEKEQSIASIPSAPRGRLIPVTKWEQYHPWPSEAGLRWLVFNAAKKGFESCVRRVGGRVLIDERRFFEWVERTGTGNSG